MKKIAALVSLVSLVALVGVSPACWRAGQPAAGAPATPAATPTATATPVPTASPVITPRSCIRPEPVPIQGRPPIGADGVFKIEAAPCTRELALRDFERIYRFWANSDGNPYRRKPGYREREEFFVPGQPAGVMWEFLLKYYAEQRGGTYPVFDPRGYDPERVRGVYQDPIGSMVWVFYERGDIPVQQRSIKDDAEAGTNVGNTGIMRWLLEWRGERYKAVAYKANAPLP